MLFLTIALLGVVLALLYSLYQNTYSYWERMGVPYEQPLPIIGNMKGIGSRLHFRDINQRIYDQFKGKTPFAGLYMFFKRVAFIIDLDLIKQLLIKDFNVFQDRGIFNNVRDEPLTGHLFTLEGDEWRSMRHKLTPVFTSGKMKHMFGIIVDVGRHLADTMDKEVAAASAEKGDVEIKELCARYTTDVIGSCAFGLECNSLADPFAEFRSKGRLIFENPRHPQIIQSFIFTNPNLARKMHLKVLRDDVANFFMTAVRSTVDHRIKNGIKRNDFLDQLIELRAENEEAARQGKGIDLSHGLTIEQMAAQAFVFFIAGFETSSSTMAFCLYELALQQDIQRRLREEIETVLKQTADGELTYEAVSQMSYLEKVLAETLRKHPILPHLMRLAKTDYPDPGTNLVIEKGTSIVIPVHNIHHDPEIYPQPERFDPERFEPAAIKARHQFAYLPFGDGPRNCIGERFGKMQAKVGLISLLRRFKFSVSEHTEIPLKFNKRNFSLSTQDGIILKVERI
ncbi:probable cytochrome P450 6a14 [Drosophila mojavensis]|uniref:probable cytochrome P450 6a14 n=1 Tax=Drosophila mojavensis TaxID=7230 RepID=UPI00017C9A04|nr:probable cytochrome P450 6a14 [Drosophila mojavensis]